MYLYKNLYMYVCVFLKNKKKIYIFLIKKYFIYNIKLYI